MIADESNYDSQEATFEFDVEEYSDVILERAQIFMEYEEELDENREVYLFTWSPDPALLPDADIRIQHRYNVNFLADMLKCCEIGLICVESTQRGNPHYHGWYQISWNTKAEMARIAHFKTMEKFGQLKITPAKYVQRNSYSEKMNALYYYKKESIDSMLSMPFNPIRAITKDDYNWNYAFFFTKDGDCKKNIADKLSHRAEMRKFYTNSDE